MPIKTALTQFESSIIHMQYLQYPFIGIVTADYELYLYDLQNNVKEKLLRLNILDNSELLCTFDSNHMQFLFGTTRSETLNLIDLRQKKIIRRFSLDQQVPTALMFVDNGLHFVCGTDQGRVLLWRCDSSTLISRLHSFPEYTSLYIKPKINFVSTMGCNENRLATSGYGGSIVITDYRSQTHTKRYHLGQVKNSALLFYKETLLVGNESGTLLKIDTEGKHPNKRLSTSMNRIKKLIKIAQEPYVLVVGDKSYCALINADTMHIINNHYIEVDQPISALCKNEKDDLYLGTQSGELIQFELSPFAHLEILIESKSYAQAYLYCEQEPILKESKSYHTLENLYQHTVQEAKILLEQEKVEQAKIKLQPFTSAKAQEISTLLATYSHIHQLGYLFNHQKFSPFYGLIEHFPLLTSTTLYAKAEKQWSERFTKAQKLMFIDKPKEAQTELLPFATVSAKRPLILLLMQHKEVLKMYSKAIHEHDYTQLNHLTNHYPILRKLPSYNDLIEKSGELIAAITDALKIQNFGYAQLLLNELALIPQYEKEYKHLKSLISNASNLHHAIAHSHWRSAYNLIDTYPELMILPWGYEIEKIWQEKLDRCEKHAVTGDAAFIKKEFTNLLNLSQRHERIGDLLRAAYYVQLKELLSSNPDSFSVGVANYCDLFGMDTEIRHLLRIAKHLQITPKLEPSLFFPKKRDQWIYHITELRNKIG